MKKNFFSVENWLSRFRYALNGLRVSFQSEQTIWVHSVVTVMVAILSLWKGIREQEAIFIVFAIGFVWASELFNTAIEKLADKVTPEYNEQIKLVKDLAASAVLIASIVAMVTGLIIFIPKFL
ncbi:MAG: diacylglycerol kinase family protein [Chitinophagaceae bacterium]